VVRTYKSPFVIITDNRERQPWDFNITIQRDSHPMLIEQACVRRKLPTGDYAIEGYETQIVIERKSPGDCIQSLTQSRKRFVREFERLQEFPWSAIVVECEWSELLKICKEKTSVHPASIDGTIIAFMQRYPRTHWIFRTNRYVAMKTTWKALYRFWQEHKVP